MINTIEVEVIARYREIDSNGKEHEKEDEFVFFMDKMATYKEKMDKAFNMAHQQYGEYLINVEIVDD